LAGKSGGYGGESPKESGGKMVGGCLPPWWILSDITPAGPDKDMGGYTAIQFTAKQQEMYGCDASGEVTNQAVHDGAITLSQSFERQSGYISAGGDILEGVMMTVEEAKVKAAGLPDCKGFCYQGELDASGKASMYFKDKWDFNAADDWTSFEYNEPDMGAGPDMGEFLREEEEINGGGMICGGTGGEADSSEDMQAMCDALTKDIEKAAQGKGFKGSITSLTVVKQKQQVVCGTNYFVKVKINGGGVGNWLHLRIFEPLPHTGEPPSLAAVKVCPDGDVPLEHFG